MRTKIKTLFIILLVVAAAFITILNMGSKLEAINHGHWLYDAEGNHNGCKNPGKDCTWSAPSPF